MEGSSRGAGCELLVLPKVRVALRSPARGTCLGTCLGRPKCGLLLQSPLSQEVEFCVQFLESWGLQLLEGGQSGEAVVKLRCRATVGAGLGGGGIAGVGLGNRKWPSPLSPPNTPASFPQISVVFFAEPEGKIEPMLKYVKLENFFLPAC